MLKSSLTTVALVVAMLVNTGVNAFGWGPCEGHVLPMGRSFD